MPAADAWVYRKSIEKLLAESPESAKIDGKLFGKLPLFQDER